MLRFGFFEDFGGWDTLLIWGDTQGLAALQQLFARLSGGTQTRTVVNAMDGGNGLPDVTLEFQLGENELHVDRRLDGVTMIGRYSAERFAEFADKVSVLADPECRSGHHYLDWPGMTSIQIIVSKGEYPDNFGAPA